MGEEGCGEEGRRVWRRGKGEHEECGDEKNSKGEEGGCDREKRVWGRQGREIVGGVRIWGGEGGVRKVRDASSKGRRGWRGECVMLKERKIW
jgi:hypothetical protein